MVKQLLKTRLAGLPAYFGGKRRLLPFIFGNLSSVIPQQDWQNIVFIDAFLGGGAVSLTAKALGFKAIHANDWSERSQLIAQGLLANQSILLKKEEVLLLAQEREMPGFIETVYCPSVFSKRHAQFLDRILTLAEQTQCPIKGALIRLLLWHQVYVSVCFPTSIGTSNRPYAEALDQLRDWDSLNAKRFVDGSIETLLKPPGSFIEQHRKAINASIFGGSPVTIYRQDAIDFVSHSAGDILYLDPPYPGTLAYEQSYRTLDSVLFGRSIRKEAPSLFSSGVDVLEALLDAGRQIPVWILSYGNKITSLGELIALMRRIEPERQIQGFSMGYKHLAHVTQDHHHQELLVVATKKE